MDKPSEPVHHLDGHFQQGPSFGELVRVFGRIGLTSFGGPAGQIAMMHRELVDERRWLDETRFLHALNYCMLLPGPEAMQLATYVGWLMHGVRGGIVAGLLFLLPGAALIVALSSLYFFFGSVPAVDGLLFGLKAAVLAVVLEALLRVARRALKTRAAWLIAVAAFAAIALFAVPFPIVILLAGVAGALLPRKTGDAVQAEDDARVMPDWTRPTAGRLLRTVAVWTAIWLLPLALLTGLLGGSHVLAVEARFFSVMAMVTFGGAYAVLAYVAQQAVEVLGWLRPDEMLTGLGLAETTPGPLILVLAFVGFLGAARQSGFDPLVGGMAGALVALWFTFVPCFLWIFAGAPYMERVRGVAWLRAALDAVTAGVVGVIANLGFWFALHVLFAEVATASYGLLSVPVPTLSSFDPLAALIAVAAGIALLRWHVNLLIVLAGAMVAGVMLKLL